MTFCSPAACAVPAPCCWSVLLVPASLLFAKSFSEQTEVSLNRRPLWMLRNKEVYLWALLVPEASSQLPAAPCPSEQNVLAVKSSPKVSRLLTFIAKAILCLVLMRTCQVSHELWSCFHNLQFLCIYFLILFSGLLFKLFSKAYLLILKTIFLNLWYKAGST